MHVWTYLIDDKALPHSPRALDWLLLMVRLWTCLCRGVASGPIPPASSQNLPPLPVSGAAAAVSLATGVRGGHLCCFRLVLSESCWMKYLLLLSGSVQLGVLGGAVPLWLALLGFRRWRGPPLPCQLAVQSSCLGSLEALAHGCCPVLQVSPDSSPSSGSCLVSPWHTDRVSQSLPLGSLPWPASPAMELLLRKSSEFEALEALSTEEALELLFSTHQVKLKFSNFGSHLPPGLCCCQ